MGKTNVQLANMATQILIAVPWLAAPNLYLNVAPAPYVTANGNTPWALLCAPQNSTAHTFAGTIGSVPNKPNIFVFMYFEQPYPTDDFAVQQTLAARVLDTYDAVAGLYIPSTGDIPGPAGTFAYGAEIEEQQHISGPYITWGQARWIGCLILISLVQEYD